MLRLDVGSQVGDIAWLPNGNLLALLLDSTSGRSVSCRLVEWQLPDLQERVLAQFFTERSSLGTWLNHELIKVDLSGEMILLGSPFSLCISACGRESRRPGTLF